MTSCNYKGEYEVGLSLPKTIEFPIDDDYK